MTESPRRGPASRAAARTRLRSRSTTPPTASRWSTCWARSRTASCRRSSGSPRTPSWRRRSRTRWSWRRWRPPSSATSTRLRDRLARARRRPVRRRWRRSRRRSTRFHAHTAPSDWYEGLIKAYVGDGLAADFYREIAAYLDARHPRPDHRARSRTPGTPTFVVDRVRAAIAADPRLGGRLALWGRRLMGEALTPGAAGRRRARRAVRAAGRRRRPAGPGPGRDRPDVHPAHRAARRADGRARPRLPERDPPDDEARQTRAGQRLAGAAAGR